MEIIGVFLYRAKHCCLVITSSLLGVVAISGKVSLTGADQPRSRRCAYLQLNRLGQTSQVGRSVTRKRARVSGMKFTDQA